MLFEKDVVKKDMEEITEREYIPFEKMKGKTVLVTGATGMLAYYCVRVLMHLNRKCNYGIRVLALVRNKEKAQNKFGNLINEEGFELIIQDVCDSICIDEEIHYIIHAAGAASPYYISHDPLSIINANVVGTVNVLELARKNPIENILFTSTREVYGEVKGKEWIAESDMGVMDPLNRRSCYPESKRMAEQIFTSYNSMYNIPFTITRIAHSYGPGMIIGNDGRVMADFMTNVVQSKDIVLKSTGEAVRAFCYISDAVAAMFCVLLNGKTGDAYNIANETEPEMIREVARKLIDVSGKKLNLVYETGADQSAYCAYQRVGLDTRKVESLGWKPEVSLETGLKRTLESFS